MTRFPLLYLRIVFNKMHGRNLFHNPPLTKDDRSPVWLSRGREELGGVCMLTPCDRSGGLCVGKALRGRRVRFHPEGLSSVAYCLTE